VPRLPIPIQCLEPEHREAVIHDLLFRKDAYKYVRFKEGLESSVSFMKANSVFYEAMVCRQKSFIIRHSMYYGVVIGGYFSFHKMNVTDKLKVE
jgi:hypothetical protein